MSERIEITESALFKQTIGFPEQIETAMEFDLPEIPSSNEICICGMGTSALVGDILSDFNDSTSHTQIHVIRRTDFPKWVDEETAVILISYSGNTKETLMAYEEATKRKCKIVCITSGGELLSKAKSRKDAAVLLPEGLQSRMALGSMLGRLASVLQEMGINKSRSELRKIIPILKENRDKIVDDDCGRARIIAYELVDKIPVIFSLANMRSAAIRWKNQINENSKNISFSGSIPEFNHNEIVGWTDDNVNSKNFVPVVLYDDNASEMVKGMTDTLLSILTDKGLKIITHHVEGSSNLEKNLKCIILGDLVSIFLADISGIDPMTDKPLRDVRDRVETSV